MKRLFCIVFIGMILLTGCAAQDSSVPMNYRWANVEGSQLESVEAGEQFYFNIMVDQGMIKTAVPVRIQLSGQVDHGSLRFELRDPSGQAVWNSGTIGAGDFSISSEYPLSSARTGTYQLGMVYSENVSAIYNLGWHAIKLGPVVLLPGIGMMLVSIAFLIYAARRKLLGWRYVGMGALFWILTVTVKFLFAIPVNPVLFRMLGVSYENVFAPANLVAYLYIGSLTGIFEAGLAWLILRSRTRWGKADWGQALVFGIGFGVIEALLLGLAGFGSALTGMLAPDVLPVYTLGSLASNTTMGLAWLILRRTRWGKADWGQALVFGIGFGVIEALLLGLAGFSSALTGMLAPDVLPVYTLGSLASNTTLSMGLAPVIERLSVIFAHIFACVLIFHAINSGEAKWGWYAILYKSLLDAPAGLAAFWGVGTAAKLWTIEGMVIIFGLIGLWGTIWIAGRYAQHHLQTSALETPV